MRPENSLFPDGEGPDDFPVFLHQYVERPARGTEIHRLERNALTDAPCEKLRRRKNLPLPGAKQNHLGAKA